MRKQWRQLAFCLLLSGGLASGLAGGFTSSPATAQGAEPTLQQAWCTVERTFPERNRNKWFNAICDSDGEVIVRQFEGRDRSGRTADFTVVAIGGDFLWAYDADRIEQVRGRPRYDPRADRGLRNDLVARLNEIYGFEFSSADVVISTGLASREGDRDYNRRLSSCRSIRLSELVEAAVADVRGDLDIRRLVLGRYEGPALKVAGGSSAVERRTLVFFVAMDDRNVNVTEALTDGAERSLKDSISQAIYGELPPQLDLANYDCWGEEFSVTPLGERRTACFAEPEAPAESYCSEFH